MKNNEKLIRGKRASISHSRVLGGVIFVVFSMIRFLEFHSPTRGISLIFGIYPVGIAMNVCAMSLLRSFVGIFGTGSGFQDFFASADKNLVLAVGLGLGLSFYVVETLC